MEISLMTCSVNYLTIFNMMGTPIDLVNIYLFNVNNRNTRKGWETCSKCFYCWLWTSKCSLVNETTWGHIILESIFGPGSNLNRSFCSEKLQFFSTFFTLIKLCFSFFLVYYEQWICVHISNKPRSIEI